MAPRRLILGSASPRRRELLSAAGLEFDVVRPEVDESLDPALTPEAAACVLAERKAHDVARRCDPDAYVLAADTIVAVDVAPATSRALDSDAARRPRLCGKPADEREARAMLEQLSGSRHQVVTGVCALRVKDGAWASGWERTWVTMRRLAAREIEDYVASGEWRDKAGGYAIQESADRFVTRLEGGGFDNVVGLPVALALRLLDALGARLADGSARH